MAKGVKSKKSARGERLSKSSQKIHQSPTLEIDTLSTSTVRLSDYAKGLSKDAKICSLSHFLETEQSDMVYIKNLMVKDGDQNIKKLKSIRSSTSDSK
jgi:hypothetical protein